ncbi:hypothetical protein BGX38DRAFT_1144091 [Terfezia claveryi]|nr:hypothetical protein BGX38DRAFT_1144091 [Terfezia claveryi]
MSHFLVEELLTLELEEFIENHGIVTYVGTTGHRVLLMGCEIEKEVVQTLIKVIVDKWIEDKVTRMDELEATYGMSSAITVQEHVRAKLILLGVYDDAEPTEYISKEKRLVSTRRSEVWKKQARYHRQWYTIVYFWPQPSENTSRPVD